MYGLKLTDQGGNTRKKIVIKCRFIVFKMTRSTEKKKWKKSARGPRNGEKTINIWQFGLLEDFGRVFLNFSAPFHFFLFCWLCMICAVILNTINLYLTIVKCWWFSPHFSAPLHFFHFSLFCWHSNNVPVNKVEVCFKCLKNINWFDVCLFKTLINWKKYKGGWEIMENTSKIPQNGQKVKCWQFLLNFSAPLHFFHFFSFWLSLYDLCGHFEYNKPRFYDN